MPFLGGILMGLGFGIVIFFGFLKVDIENNMSSLAKETAPIPIPSLDAPAPNFKLVNIEGETIQLEDFRGKPLLLNFWASWCAPCRLEMPTFQSYYDKFAGELAVVAINNGEDREDVRIFTDELNITFDVLLDPKADIQRLYQIRGYPTTFLIDPDGIIRIRHVGLITEEQLEILLRELGFSEK